MHLFISIVAAGITLYLLRNWWERFQVRRAERQLERALNPPRRSRFGRWCDKLDNDYRELELERRSAKAGSAG